MGRPKISIEYRKTDELKAYGRNARKHPGQQIDALAKAIRRFGFLVPVIVEADGTLITGHGRVEAARKIGLEEVPTVSAEGLSAAEIRALRLADNKLGDKSDWNKSALAAELSWIMDNVGDVEVTGFDSIELTKLLGTEQGHAQELPPASIQLKPAQEYLVVVCEDQEQWDKLRQALNLGLVSKRGYKQGSDFVTVGQERVIKAERILELC
jgi:hypothetical protein